jgi:hypothetical protein
MKKETAEEKSKRLEYSRTFDIHKWSEFSEVKECVDAIYKEIKRFKVIKDKRDYLIKKHLKVLIVDLWCAWNQDTKLYIGISRRLPDYKKNVRYGKLGLGYKPMIATLDVLEKKGYITQDIGWLDRNRNVGRNTKIKATQKLIQKIVDEHGIKESHIQRCKNQECIIMKEVIKIDGKERKVEFKYDEFLCFVISENTIRMRKDLISYNNLLRRTHIDIPNYSKDIKADFEDESDKFVRRIFNNNEWTHGGRFYGGWWQRIRNYDRKNIRINGKAVVEIDYSAIHIVILYSIVGIDYWSLGRKDAYDLSSYGYDMDDRVRNFLKLILLVSVNAKKGKKKDVTEATKVVRNEIRLDGYKEQDEQELAWVHDVFGVGGKVSNEKIEQLIIDFADYHKDIKQFFYSKKGVELQYIDSLIAEKIINHFTMLDIPVLCIHDSFVIQSDKIDLGDEEDSLDWMMNIFFNKVIKDNFKSQSYAKLKQVGGLNLNAHTIIKDLEKVKSDKKYMTRFKNHQEKEWFKNYYHDDDIKYS